MTSMKMHVEGVFFDSFPMFVVTVPQNRDSVLSDYIKVITKYWPCFIKMITSIVRYGRPIWSSSAGNKL